MGNPIERLIDLEAVAHNLRLVRTLAPGARVLAMLKAEAYGHGALRIARAIEHDIDAIGVARLDEALKLRAAGIGAPVLLMGGILGPEDVVPALEAGFWQVVHAPWQVEALANLPLLPPIWLKLATGLGRLGLNEPEFRAALAVLQDRAEDIVLMTHFAAADNLESDLTVQQITRFDAMCAELPYAHSLANSAGILAWPEAHRDWVRPGLMLYGISPIAGADEVLKPAIHLRARLIAKRRMHAGEGVGYGPAYICARDMEVGIVACGYGDGYPRNAGEGQAPAFVNGQESRLVGRVSMDMLAIDLTGIEAAVGDNVELLGSNAPATALAEAARESPYEVVTRITTRAQLQYKVL